MLVYRDSAIQSFSRRFCTVYKSVKSDPLKPSGRRDILSERLTVQASSVRTTRTFHPDLPLCREASNCSSLQHVRMPLNVRLAMRFLSKTQIWEDGCNRPDDVDSHPNAFIHKASRSFKIKTSRRQSSWSERASYIYGNYMHQINRSNDMFYGPDARSLDMEIAYS
jgi:hypothetical protein